MLEGLSAAQQDANSAKRAVNFNPALSVVSSVFVMPFLSKFKPVEFRGFKYFSGTREKFGLVAALTQLSPLLNTLRFPSSLFCLGALFLFAGCFSGCSVVSNDRVFPKLAWYWSYDAQQQRAANRERVEGVYDAATTAAASRTNHTSL